MLRTAAPPQHSPYTSSKGKLPLGPVYVKVCVTGPVGPGWLMTSRAPTWSCSPSSWVTVKVWLVVTVTVPVKSNIVPDVPLSKTLARSAAVAVIPNAPPLARKAPNVEPPAFVKLSGVGAVKVAFGAPCANPITAF